MLQYTLTTPGLEKQQALFISAMLDEAAHPLAHAVVCNCTNEASDLWAVEAYYDDPPDPQALEALLEDSSLDLSQIKIVPLEDRNWVEESLKGLAPVSAGRFHIHGTHDRATCKPYSINVEIDAGVAFGTGHHATTTGCLLALGDIVREQRPTKALDVGCGTGVLSIAAARCLKIPILASDIDPVAVKVALNNARLNAAAPFITTLTATGTHHPAIRARAPFDLIFANILAGPLVAMAPDLAGLVSPTGRLVLSGLTTDQERWVIAAYRTTGLVVQKRHVINNWSTLVLTRITCPDTQKIRHARRTGQLAVAKWLARRFARP